MRQAGFLILLFASASVLGQPTCSDIVNDDQRLLCYDQQQNGRSSTQTQAPNEEEQQFQHESDGQDTVTAEGTVLEGRQRQEQSLYENSFGIMSHHRTYILPFSWVFNVEDEPLGNIDNTNSSEDLDSTEIKFQFSFKVPIGRRFLLGDDLLYFGFTQVSLWQAYNGSLSSPFRENNYQPELLWQIPLSEPLFNGRLSHVVFGLNHHSNGQGGDLSRSWNRVTFDTTWADENWAINLKLWKRIEEKEKDDDNPDIEDFMGYGQLQLGYRWGDKRFTTIIYNNFESDNNHTSVDISYSQPISRKLRGFVQYFNGYGETLINYNRRTRRIGVGVVLSDWF